MAFDILSPVHGWRHSNNRHGMMSARPALIIAWRTAIPAPLSSSFAFHGVVTHAGGRCGDRLLNTAWSCRAEASRVLCIWLPARSLSAKSHEKPLLRVVADLAKMAMISSRPPLTLSAMGRPVRVTFTS